MRANPKPFLGFSDNAELGVTFFAILLPWETELVSLEALDGDGQVLPLTAS